MTGIETKTVTLANKNRVTYTHVRLSLAAIYYITYSLEPVYAVIKNT